MEAIFLFTEMMCPSRQVKTIRIGISAIDSENNNEVFNVGCVQAISATLDFSKCTSLGVL